MGPKTFEGPPTYLAHTDERYLLSDAHIRWAVWCVESLYQLRDLIDIADARDDTWTPQGHRAAPVAMGHVMWATITAMGALDRIAASFGALSLPPFKPGRVHDLGSLTHDKTPAIENDAIRQWIANVEADPAYVDLLSVFRHVMTHRTTPTALYARAHNAITFGEAPDDAEQETPGLPDWEGRAPHQDAPDLYLTDNRVRSIGAVELLDKVTPSVERHVRAALDLVRTGLGLPDDGPYHFREWPPKQGRQTSQNAPRHPGPRGRDEATSQGLRRRSTQPGA